MPVTSLERVQAAALTHILAGAPRPSRFSETTLAMKWATRLWAEGTVLITHGVLAIRVQEVLVQLTEVFWDMFSVFTLSHS